MNAASSDDVLYAVSDGVATITLNRPQKLNALRIETYEALIEALRAAADASVGVVAIRGAGRAFCSGGDIEMAQSVLTSEHEARRHFFGRMIETSKLVMALDKPVICAVQGACVGGGAELVTFADLAIAGESAFFLFNGTKIGGGNWWGAAQLLPLLVGFRRAEEILYLSRRVDAAEAEQIGFVTRVVPDTELGSAVDDVCSRLLDLSEDGIRLTKGGLRSTKELLLASLAAGAEMNVAALTKPGLHDAFRAFREGRELSWRELRA